MKTVNLKGSYTVQFMQCSWSDKIIQLEKRLVVVKDDGRGKAQEEIFVMTE